MVPWLNAAPGPRVFSKVGGTPELSVAVGSVHVTVVAVLPVGAVTVMSSGQPVITGGVRSSEGTVGVETRFGSFVKYKLILLGQGCHPLIISFYSFNHRKKYHSLQKCDVFILHFQLNKFSL